VSAALQRFLAAQQGMLGVLAARGDEAALRRAAERLERAFEGLTGGRGPAGETGLDGAGLERARSLAALLLARAAERRSDLVRELGRTRLARRILREQSTGPRTGGSCDVAG
jgi:hypothetical protein